MRVQQRGPYPLDNVCLQHPQRHQRQALQGRRVLRAGGEGELAHSPCAGREEHLDDADLARSKPCWRRWVWLGGRLGGWQSRSGPLQELDGEDEGGEERREGLWGFERLLGPLARPPRGEAEETGEGEEDGLEMDRLAVPCHLVHDRRAKQAEQQAKVGGGGRVAGEGEALLGDVHEPPTEGEQVVCGLGERAGGHGGAQVVRAGGEDVVLDAGEDGELVVGVARGGRKLDGALVVSGGQHEAGAARLLAAERVPVAGQIAHVDETVVEQSGGGVGFLAKVGGGGVLPAALRRKVSLLQGGGGGGGSGEEEAQPVAEDHEERKALVDQREHVPLHLVALGAGGRGGEEDARLLDGRVVQSVPEGRDEGALGDKGGVGGGELLVQETEVVARLEPGDVPVVAGADAAADLELQPVDPQLVLEDLVVDARRRASPLHQWPCTRHAGQFSRACR